MSNKTDSKVIGLENQVTDYVASAAKSIVGAVPFAGSLLVEIAGTVIPNQRMDRIARFAAILETRIAHIDQDTMRPKLTDENCIDLTEEALRQAARSLSDERQEYIASILVNGLCAKDIQLVELRHLLKILGEINDIEVIWLRFYVMPTVGGDAEFRQIHAELLKPAIAFINAPQEVLDKSALQESYKEHLAIMNLLKRELDYERRDPISGGPRFRGYSITLLGRLLLRQIGLFGGENRPPIDFKITPLDQIGPHPNA